jgi:hypothetical protein
MSLKPAYLAPLLVAGTAAASIAVGPIAAADPVWPVAGAEDARATIADLQAQGYNVQINWVNGTSNVPLYLCHVTGINNPDRSRASEATFTTVYVDVVCPSEDWDRGSFGVGIGI